MAPIPFKSTAAQKGDSHYDLIVIGGGSGGLGAARRAAQYGAKGASRSLALLPPLCVDSCSWL